MTDNQLWPMRSVEPDLTGLGNSKRRMPLLVAMVALVITLASACGGNSSNNTNGADGKPVNGGTLDVGLTIDISSLNPYSGTGDTTDLITANINAQLFNDYDNKVVPAIAQSMTLSGDGKTATITLRKGLKFSNGKPITPKDVVFSIEQAKLGARYGSLYQEIITSEKAGPGDKVVLTLVRPTLDLEELLSFPGTAIIPANFGGKSEAAYFQDPVGAGPYMLVSRQPGVSINLKKNPYYWDTGKPYIDNLHFEVFNNENALTSAYLDKTIQAIPFADDSEVPNLTGATIVNTAYGETEVLFVNGRTGPLSNLKVRQAISMAIDRQAILKSIRPRDMATETLLPPVVLGSAKPTPLKDGDIEAAKKLLAASPYKNGATINVIYPTGDDTLALTVQAIQEEVAKIGIKFNLQALDEGTWVNNVLSGKYQLAYLNISANGSTAETSLQFWISTKAIDGGWSTEPAQTALTQYEEATDAAGEAAALEKFQDYVNAVQPIIPVVAVSPILALSPSVGGYADMGTVISQGLPFEELWLNKP